MQSMPGMLSKLENDCRERSKDMESWGRLRGEIGSFSEGYLFHNILAMGGKYRVPQKPYWLKEK